MHTISFNGSSVGLIHHFAELVFLFTFHSLKDVCVWGGGVSLAAKYTEDELQFVGSPVSKIQYIAVNS